MRKQSQHWNLGLWSGYLYIFNLYQISILINHSDVTQMIILLLPQVSVVSPQNAFLGL